MGAIESIDIKFLSEVTKLSPDKVLTLAESDFDLIADTLSDKDIGLYPISLSLFVKMRIFQETKGTGYSLQEKSYVADCVSTHYPKMFTTSHYLLDKPKLSETDGQYYLVLVGMFPEFLMRKTTRNGAPDISFYTNLSKKAFFESNKVDLANHIDDWVDLLYYIKKYCWN